MQRSFQCSATSTLTADPLSSAGAIWPTPTHPIDHTSHSADTALFHGVSRGIGKLCPPVARAKGCAGRARPKLLAGQILSDDHET